MGVSYKSVFGESMETNLNYEKTTDTTRSSISPVHICFSFMRPGLEYSDVIKTNSSQHHKDQTEKLTKWGGTKRNWM